MERPLGLGASHTLKDGTIVNVRKVEGKRKIPGSTAQHEAAHVVAAGEIVHATIIPSGDALGTTQPVRMTAAAAAAADAMGYDGTGWDMFLTEHFLGVDAGTARSAARAALSGKQEEMWEVATILQEQKTIGQPEVRQAWQNVYERRQGIFPIKVEIITPDGKVKALNTKSFRNEVKMSDLVGALPKAA